QRAHAEGRPLASREDRAFGGDGLPRRKPDGTNRPPRRESPACVLMERLAFRSQSWAIQLSQGFHRASPAISVGPSSPRRLTSPAKRGVATREKGWNRLGRIQP